MYEYTFKFKPEPHSIIEGVAHKKNTGYEIYFKTKHYDIRLITDESENISYTICNHRHTKTTDSQESVTKGNTTDIRLTLSSCTKEEIDCIESVVKQLQQHSKKDRKESNND